MLIDACTFFNELDLLELRFRTLDKVVDRFVVVESDLTHSGKRKAAFFERDFAANHSRWAPWKDRLEIVSADLAHCGSAWAREGYQRDCILQGLSNVPGSAMVMISDVDEIPSPTMAGRQGIYEQLMYTYYFNVRNKYNWRGTICLSKDTWAQNGPNSIRQDMHRGIFRGLPMVQHGGWHFSSMGGPEAVKTKLSSYAHTEYGTPENLAKVEESMELLTDVFDRGEEYDVVTEPYVVKGLKNYQDYLYQG